MEIQNHGLHGLHGPKGLPSEPTLPSCAMTEPAANASVDPSSSTPQPSTAERNVRKLVDVLVTLQGGASTEDLRRGFETATGRARQTYYNTLAAAKARGWIIGEGSRWNKRNILNPDGCWREVPSPPLERLLERDQLEYVASSRAAKIEELEDEVRRLVDGAADGANIAVSSLVRIVGDGTVSTPRRLKAAGVLLGYKVQSDDVVGLAKKYLESLCGNPDTPLGHQIEAAELLQKHGKVMQPIERPSARTDNEIETEEVRRERAEAMQRRHEHIDRMSALMEADLSLKDWRTG